MKLRIIAILILLLIVSPLAAQDVDIPSASSSDSFNALNTWLIPFFEPGGLGDEARSKSYSQIKSDIVSGAVATFTGLTDTPSSITANNVVRGNGAGSALIFSLVDTNQLANNAVTQTKIANNAVGTSEIRSGGVATDDLALGAVTLNRLDDGTAGRYIGFNASGEPSELTAPAISGDFTDLDDTPSSIVGGRVVLTNSAGNALIFGLVGEDHLSNTLEGVIDDSVASVTKSGNTVTVTENDGGSNTFSVASTGGSSDFVDLGDTPSSIPPTA